MAVYDPHNQENAPYKNSREERYPRTNDIVRCPEGQIGRIKTTVGSFNQRIVTVEDIHRVEIYTNQPVDSFTVVSTQVAKKFYMDQLALNGFIPGKICLLREDENFPMQIIEADYKIQKFTSHLWVKELLSFDQKIYKTLHENDITVVNIELPSYESFFSSIDSNLQYKLKLELVNKNSDGWLPCGSPFEFLTETDAKKEIESLKSRLMIRRVASVINGDWNPKSAEEAFTIELKRKNGKILHRIALVETGTNAYIGYFKTALLAALALNYLKVETWISASYFSQDEFLGV